MDSTKNTQDLVQHTSSILHRLEKQGRLSNNLHYLRIPFQSEEGDLFQERKEGGKRRLVNGLGQSVPSDRIEVMRAICVQINKTESGKKIVKVDTKPERPNIVYFKESEGSEFDKQMSDQVADIAFELWRMSKQLSEREMNDVLRELTSVLFHYQGKDAGKCCKMLLFTSVDDGQYLAPLASLHDQDQSREQLTDMMNVLDTGKIAPHIKSIGSAALEDLKRKYAPQLDKSVNDLQRAVYSAQQNKSDAMDVASQVLNQNFKIRPSQAVDLYDALLNSKKDQRLQVQNMSNNILMGIASGNSQSDLLTNREKSHIFNDAFVERIANRVRL